MVQPFGTKVMDSFLSTFDSSGRILFILRRKSLLP